MIDNRIPARRAASPSRPRGLRSVRRHGEGPAGYSGHARVTLQRPFLIGFVGTIGALAAIAVGVALGALSTVVIYIIAALFIALGLDPAVSWLAARRGINRGLAIAIVFVAFALIVLAVVVLVLPVLITQIVQFARELPGYLTSLSAQPWVTDLNIQLAGTLDIDAMIAALRAFISNPGNWAIVAGGLLNAGIGVINGVVAAMIVLILTLYFLASMRAMKASAATLVVGSRRAGFMSMVDEITGSIGGYVNGMVILAAINAGLGFVAMIIFGVPYAGVLAVLVFLLALIPLIGTIIGTILVTVVGLFNSPATALGIGIYYLIFMQIEAYVLTPRIMNRAVAVPGSLVVIGAMAGGTLLGILGALIAIPVTASILLIIKKVWVPLQDSR